ncbi:MAG: hypothetical protein SGPRY_014261, partial [Prymnesium sp.]
MPVPTGNVCVFVHGALSPDFNVEPGVSTLTYSVASNSTVTITGKYVVDRGEWNHK